MNLGVIRSLKAHYCGRVVRRLCRTLDKKKTLPKLSILQGMKILVFSWGAVSAQTIVNCFRKAGITPEAQNPAIRDAGDPFSVLKEHLQQRRGIDPDIVPEGVTPESLIDVDKEVITMTPMITDDDILKSVTTNQQEKSDKDDDNNEEVEEVAPERPLRFQSQVELPIDNIRNAALYNSNGEELSVVISKFEKLFIEHRIASKKQTNIFDFFKPV